MARKDLTHLNNHLLRFLGFAVGWLNVASMRILLHYQGLVTIEKYKD